MSDDKNLLNDPMVLRELIMDHYQYPHNHELTKEEGYSSRHMASDSCIDELKTSALTVLPARFPRPAHP